MENTGRSLQFLIDNLFLVLDLLFLLLDVLAEVGTRDIDRVALVDGLAGVVLAVSETFLDFLVDLVPLLTNQVSTLHSLVSRFGGFY